MGIIFVRMLSNTRENITVWSAIGKEIVFTKRIEKTGRNQDIILFAVPSVFVRGIAARAAKYIPDGQVIVDVAKGIESENLNTITNVIGDELSKDRNHPNIQLVPFLGLQMQKEWNVICLPQLCQYVLIHQ